MNPGLKVKVKVKVKVKACNLIYKRFVTSFRQRYPGRAHGERVRKS